MDQAISQADVQSPALAEPTQHVRTRWILGLADPLPGYPVHRHGHPVPAVLPARRGIAIVCPYAIGPLIAAPLVSLAGYPALFGATAAVAIVASIGVWKIKSVR